MAPTILQRAPDDSSTPPSMTSNSHRVTKSRPERIGSSDSRMTRQRSKMLAEGSSSGNGILQDMVYEAQAVVGCGARFTSTFKSKGKGKGKEAASQSDENEQFMEDIEHDMDPLGGTSPSENKVENPFRIMDLPAEIRLEIYRCCLTRPYNILLSKREQPVLMDLDMDIRGLDDRILRESTDSDDDDSLARSATPSPRASRARRSTDLTPGRAHLASNYHGLTTRGSRPQRLVNSRSAPSPQNNNPSGSSKVGPRPPAISRSVRRTLESRSSRQNIMPQEPHRPQSQDPLIVNILRTTKHIYKEARSVFYSENLFTLDLATAMPTLACLHQRSRRQIKHIEIEIPTYNEILERFQETVRLSLRYCSGLKEFVIHMPFTLPGADGSGTTGNTTVYANGFDILRWLPQECNINLQGNVCTEIERVVNKHQHLAKHLDKVRHHRLMYSPYTEEAEWQHEMQRLEEKKTRREAEAAATTQAQQ